MSGTEACPIWFFSRAEFVLLWRMAVAFLLGEGWGCWRVNSAHSLKASGLRLLVSRCYKKPILKNCSRWCSVALATSSHFFQLRNEITWVNCGKEAKNVMTQRPSCPGKASLGCYTNWRSTYYLNEFQWKPWLPNYMVCFDRGYFKDWSWKVMLLPSLPTSHNAVNSSKVKAI